ncbi:tetratricopeptide repeat protein [Qaidamihabitans albus]|uniref:tetratricopeptide repeat protein n=1 Tax=Qaidamihabitans albus TaxID=2795733 RepID=UPI0018F2334B|nr:hypothetical protein [Qaidamihabitans albus]
MRAQRVPNHRLRSLLGRAGLNGPALARMVNRIGAESGLDLTYQRASVAQWLSGVRPRSPVPELIAESLSRRLGRRVTIEEIGLGAPESTARIGRRPWWATAAPDRLVEAYRAAGPSQSPVAPAYSIAALSAPSWTALAGMIPAEEPKGRTTTRVGSTEITSATAMLHVFSGADLNFGGGHARSALAGYLACTIAPWLRADGRSAVRRELLSTAARLSYLCGFMCFDDESHSVAQQYYLTTLRLAAEGGDRCTYAMALRGLSAQARLLGHGGEAVALAESAVRTASGHVPPHARAFLLGQVGVAQAAVGNRRASLAALGRAEAQLARADGGSSPGGTSHAASLAYQSAAAANCLGDRGAAIRALGVSIRNRSRSERRTHAISLARLAELQLAEGRLEQACATWHEFLDHYSPLESRRAERALDLLRAHTRPFQNNSVARGLRERAMTIRT